MKAVEEALGHLVEPNRILVEVRLLVEVCLVVRAFSGALILVVRGQPSTSPKQLNTHRQKSGFNELVEFRGSEDISGKTDERGLRHL